MQCHFRMARYTGLAGQQLKIAECHLVNRDEHIFSTLPSESCNVFEIELL